MCLHNCVYMCIHVLNISVFQYFRKTGLPDPARQVSENIAAKWGITDEKIVVKFKTDIPREIFARPAHEDEINTRRTDFFVADFLTPIRSSILFELRQLRKGYPSVINRVASRRGRPGLFWHEDTRFVSVETAVRLNRLRLELEQQHGPPVRTVPAAHEAPQRVHQSHEFQEARRSTSDPSPLTTDAAPNGANGGVDAATRSGSIGTPLIDENTS